MAKFSDKTFWGYWPSREGHYALRNTEMSITDEILDNIFFQHRNRYFLIIQPNFSQESDAKLADKIQINPFIGLLCLAGALRSNKETVEELWGSVCDGIGKFRLVTSHRRFKIPVRCLNKLKLYP